MDPDRRSNSRWWDRQVDPFVFSPGTFEEHEDGWSWSCGFAGDHGFPQSHANVHSHKETCDCSSRTLLVSDS